MKCTPVRFTGGVGFVCSQRRLRIPLCSEPGCGALGERQCDFPVAPGRTCDRYLCAKHATPAGPGLDHCPSHTGRPHQADLFESADAGL